MPINKITDEIALTTAKKLKIDLNVIPFKWWKYGMQVELEHNRGVQTNVAKDNMFIVGRIALAHLNEFPDYYQRLKRMEETADIFWQGKRKPRPTKK